MLEGQILNRTPDAIEVRVIPMQIFDGFKFNILQLQYGKQSMVSVQCIKDVILASKLVIEKEWVNMKEFTLSCMPSANLLLKIQMLKSFTIRV